MTTLALVASVLLGLVSLALSRRLSGLSTSRDEVVRSFAGGVSIAFVMLDLFVELAESSASELHQRLRAGPEPVHTMAVMLLLGGLASFAAAVLSHRRGSARMDHLVVWGPHSLYCVLVGASLVEEAHEGPLALAPLFVAMVVHLGTVDHRFPTRFPEQHGVAAGTISFVAVVAGAIVGAVAAPPAFIFEAILALVAGNTLLEVFGNELPPVEGARIGAFIGGAFTFSVL